MGSGPYKIDSLDPGKWIKYKRVDDYWGKDLPVNKGKYNFDYITYDYYRDFTVAIEALKAGEYDLRAENISKVWATSYEIDAVKDGRMIKENITHERPTGMQGFIFNLRKPKFDDIKVREALSYTFDFEWTNKNIFYGAYTRTTSFFSNSELASSGLPEGLELEILKEYALRQRLKGEPITPEEEYRKLYAKIPASYKRFLPPEVFYKEYNPPSTDGSGNVRANLRIASKLLKDAGLKVVEGVLHLPDGTPFELEFLLSSPTYERMVGPMIANLKKLGIESMIRTVDSSQYIKRIEDFDFDIIVHSYGQSLSPGNEQEDYWNSDRADIRGSRNVSGIKSPIVDNLVEKIIKAPNKETLIAATRALDRVLLNYHYVIPQYHIRDHRLIYWNKFSRPIISEKYLPGIDNWWIK